jgi:hypothetical protein
MLEPRRMTLTREDAIALIAELRVSMDRLRGFGTGWPEPVM